MLQEYNVDYIWASLSDFWKLFEDAGVIEQLWRGYAFTVNNLYYQLYQLSLSKCIHTIPYKWVSDYEVFTQDEFTAVPNAPVRFTGYPYAYRLPFGVKNVTMLRESPREVTNLPQNTILTPDNLLVLPDGTVRHAGDKIYMPSEVIDAGDYLVFPLGVSVETEKYYPNIDFIVDESDRTIHFKLKPYTLLWSNLAIRDLEIIYDNFGSLIDFYKPDSYKYLREVQGLWYAYWNGSTLYNIGTGVNILKDLPFVLEDGIVTAVNNSLNVATIGTVQIEVTDAQLSTLAVGQAVEYVNVTDSVVRIAGKYYKLPTGQVANLAVGDDILAIAPATASVTVNETIYPIPANQVVDVAVGEYVSKFQPLTQAVGIFDYINYPGWWREYAGINDESEVNCFFDGNPYFDGGKFDKGNFDDVYSERCLESIFLQYFTFLVRINQETWFRTREDFEVVRAFLFAIKPAYTHFLFELVLNFEDDAPVFELTPPQFDWNYVPIDVPLAHHHFDEQYIHPTFDDGGYFDFNHEQGPGRYTNEREWLWVTIYGSPEIFYDDDVLGYTFDDPAVTTFDWREIGHLREHPQTLSIPGYTQFIYDNANGEGMPRSAPILYTDELPEVLAYPYADFMSFDRTPYTDSMVFDLRYIIPQDLSFSDNALSKANNIGLFNVNDPNLTGFEPSAPTMDNLFDENPAFIVPGLVRHQNDPIIFDDDSLIGYTFDDEGIRKFDSQLPFDSNPHNDILDIEEHNSP